MRIPARAISASIFSSFPVVRGHISTQLPACIPVKQPLLLSHGQASKEVPSLEEQASSVLCNVSENGFAGKSTVQPEM